MELYEYKYVVLPFQAQVLNDKQALFWKKVGLCNIRNFSR